MIQIITDDVGFDENELDFMIYPNPANSTVNLNGIAEGASVELINLLGQTVYSQQNSKKSFSIDIESYQSGTYFIRVTTEKGQLTKKLLVRH